jgi:protein TonB
MPAQMRSVDQGPLHITAPRFRVPPAPPVYPRSARQLGQEGEVLIRANLDPEGNPEEVRLLRSSGIEALDRAAIAAVRRWVFEPGRRNGVAVVAWVQVPIRFTLR